MNEQKLTPFLQQLTLLTPNQQPSLRRNIETSSAEVLTIEATLRECSHGKYIKLPDYP